MLDREGPTVMISDPGHPDRTSRVRASFIRILDYPLFWEEEPEYCIMNKPVGAVNNKKSPGFAARGSIKL
jgi:hypothetical protein